MNTAATHPALQRAWLRPTDVALCALTDDEICVDTLRRDPGLVLHFLRYTRPTPHPETLHLDPVAFAQPGLCETAAALIEREPNPPPIDGDGLRCGLELAIAAKGIAAETGHCSPDAAWCAGLLAGYFYSGQQPGRKLLARWRLPTWVTIAVGFQELPADDAVALGGHRGLLEVLSAARGAVRRESLTTAVTPVTDSAQLTCTANPLWPTLLRLAAKNRQRSAAQLVAELEDRIDRLTDRLAASREEFDSAVRDAKLDGLAEFAAGAGHEINNPLAVIATNVQLLRSEEDDERRLERYDVVLRQTRRIHDILAGTRQFARPPQPNPTLLCLSAWVPAVGKELQPDADSLGVELHLPDLAGDCRVWADATHIRAVVTALGRNAIQAAGAGGWVRVRVEPGEEWTRVVVEDSGPGPIAAAVPHLFDPFYSGRNAGRGRGLGLSVAWRLAKKTGGDVQYERTEQGPTRFAFTLPTEPAPECLPLPERKSA